MRLLPQKAVTLKKKKPVDFYFKKQSIFEAHAFTFCPRIFENTL